jgi:DNA (cytosine-5)-methyltransferase 1
MDYISLFTGIGGFDLGLDRAGMKCVAQVENNPFCQKVLQKHWPHIVRYGDIRDVGRNRKHNLPYADVICGGFPCQPHSQAGKRKGKADDRDLWPEYFRIVDEYRPNWVVGENVLGIRTTILDQVLSDLEGLGYSTVTIDIPACAFNAPHRRERMFIVAHAKSRARRLSISAWEAEASLYPGRNGETWNVTDASGTGLSERKAQSNSPIRPTERTGLVDGREANYWQSEPGVCGVADGVPDRMDRIRTLGNAIVPQMSEFIGSGIVQIETCLTPHGADSLPGSVLAGFPAR